MSNSFGNIQVLVLALFSLQASHSMNLPLLNHAESSAVQTPDTKMKILTSYSNPCDEMAGKNECVSPHGDLFVSKYQPLLSIEDHIPMDHSYYHVNMISKGELKQDREAQGTHTQRNEIQHLNDKLTTWRQNAVLNTKITHLWDSYLQLSGILMVLHKNLTLLKTHTQVLVKSLETLLHKIEPINMEIGFDQEHNRFILQLQDLIFQTADYMHKFSLITKKDFMEFTEANEETLNIIAINIFNKFGFWIHKYSFDLGTPTFYASKYVLWHILYSSTDSLHYRNIFQVLNERQIRKLTYHFINSCAIFGNKVDGITKEDILVKNLSNQLEESGHSILKDNKFFHQMEEYVSMPAEEKENFKQNFQTSELKTMLEGGCSLLQKIWEEATDTPDRIMINGRISHAPTLCLLLDFFDKNYGEFLLDSIKGMDSLMERLHSKFELSQLSSKLDNYYRVYFPQGVPSPSDFIFINSKGNKFSTQEARKDIINHVDHITIKHGDFFDTFDNVHEREVYMRRIEILWKTIDVNTQSIHPVSPNENEEVIRSPTSHHFTQIYPKTKTNI